jgi:Peptidase family M28
LKPAQPIKIISMRIILILVITLRFAFTGFSQINPTLQKYAATITEADLKENLTILASDALEGRETGKRGQKMAAAFIANYFHELGLVAPLNGSHYQPVNLYSVTPGAIYLKSDDKVFTNFKEVVYYGETDSEGEVSTEAVFVGKGTEADYEGLSVKNKAVVLFTESLSFNVLSALRKPIALAHEKGALMVLVVSATKTTDFATFASQLEGWLSEGELTLDKPETNSSDKGIFMIEQQVAEKIFNTPFAKLTKAANESPKGKALPKLKPAKISYQVAMTVKTVSSENMLGYLEGSDKKEELIVITAHYDHIGISNHVTGDTINNGADDDGSGTVAVLEMAQAFVQAKKEGNGPRRSILFMTVTGEEQGLFGSQYYVEHPVFPLANTIANLNIDMIGRRDPEHNGKPDYVYVIGSDKLSSELHEINERNNNIYTKLQFDYTYNDEDHPTNLYKRSDHWNFARNGIPIIFYFDGIHEDYHQVSDEVSKIEFDLLAKRAQSLFYTAWELANRDTRIVVDKK